MRYYLKNYPISLLVILTVVYLSFFNPPSTDLNKVEGFDKVVHLCMYAGLSGMLWLEFWRAHRRSPVPKWHVWVGAALCPILFSGLVELLQEYCTVHRSGDWMDFAANTLGVLLASLIGSRLRYSA